MMVSDSNKKLLPFGTVTLCLLAFALALQFWPKSSCEQLLQTEQGQGLFMTWQAPVLILLNSRKEQLSYEASSKEAACALALEDQNRIEKP